jgi:hypothetical protein
VTTIQFQPAVSGGWVAIAAGSRTLVVGGAPDAALVAAVWEVLGASSGLEATLDLLIARGIATTPVFALLDLDDTGELRAIVRGEVNVVVETAGGSETLGGTGVAAFTERNFEAASRISVTVLGAVAAPGIGALPLVSGSAVIAGFELVREEADAAAAAAPVVVEVPEAVAPPAAAPVVEPVAAPAAPPVVVEVPAVVAAPAPVVAAAPAPAPAPAPTTAPDQEFTEITQVSGDDSDDDDDVVSADTAVAEREAAIDDEVEEIAEAAPSDQVSDADAATVVIPSRRKRAPLPGDHDGHTVLSSDIAKLREDRAAGTATGATAPPPPPAPAVALITASGTREPLTQPILVGRAPTVTQVSGGQLPRLITVGGIDQDISRNHVRFSLEGGTVVVTDLHSRNGTTIAMPGKDPQKLRGGEPTSVISGTVVDLGSGVTFTVDEAR